MTDQGVKVVVLRDGGDGAPGVVCEEGEARCVVGRVRRHRADESRKGRPVAEGRRHRAEGYLQEGK